MSCCAKKEISDWLFPCQRAFLNALEPWDDPASDDGALLFGVCPLTEASLTVPVDLDQAQLIKRLLILCFRQCDAWPCG